MRGKTFLAHRRARLYEKESVFCDLSDVLEILDAEFDFHAAMFVSVVPVGWKGSSMNIGTYGVTAKNQHIKWLKGSIFRL
jgi:hypothetical protein